MDIQAICWVMFLGLAMIALTFIGGVLYGATGARRKMAAELVAMYMYAGAEGSKAREEVKGAIRLVMEEFDAFKAKTTVVWAWVHKTINAAESDAKKLKAKL